LPYLKTICFSTDFLQIAFDQWHFCSRKMKRIYPKNFPIENEFKTSSKRLQVDIRIV